MKFIFAFIIFASIAQAKPTVSNTNISGNVALCDAIQSDFDTLTIYVSMLNKLKNKLSSSGASADSDVYKNMVSLIKMTQKSVDDSKAQVIKNNSAHLASGTIIMETEISVSTERLNDLSGSRKVKFSEENAVGNLILIPSTTLNVRFFGSTFCAEYKRANNDADIAAQNIIDSMVAQ